MELSELGWNDHFSKSFKEFGERGLLPARVASAHSRIYLVITPEGEYQSEISGRLTHSSKGRTDYPVVGDWVAIDSRPAVSEATIHHILPRTSAFTRKGAGKKTEAQVLAANIDIVFLVSGLDGDFNPSRIERYLTVAWESGASPVIVLNKVDICPDPAAAVAVAEALAPEIPILPVSASENIGLEKLTDLIDGGKTVVFLGSSGVGKSSLVNALLGADRQLVREVREDDSRGRHTTSRSELFSLPGGGLVIDTPGLRELQLWSEGEGLSQAFNDIEKLSENCRFRDCRHDMEPQCAVKLALDEGTLDARRWQSYQKLKKEVERLAARRDALAKIKEKQKDKDLSVRIKKVKKRPRA